MDSYLSKSNTYSKVLSEFRDGLKPSEVKARRLIDKDVRILQAFFIRRIIKKRREKKLNISASSGGNYLAQYKACLKIQMVAALFPFTHSVI